MNLVLLDDTGLTSSEFDGVSMRNSGVTGRQRKGDSTPLKIEVKTDTYI